MIGWLALAALAASSLPAPPAGTSSVAQRAAGSATAQIMVRIVRTSASIGHGRVPPPGAHPPRAATLAAADGRPVHALIYDFE